MSSDRQTGSAGPTPPDELLSTLRAYGSTLAALVDEPIRPDDRPAEPAGVLASAEQPAILTGVDADGAGPSPASAASEVARTGVRRGVWLAAAAIVVVVAGFGLTRLWPSGSGSISSTDSPGGDQVDETPDTGDPAGADADAARDTGAEEDVGQGTPTSAARSEVPSIIVGVDDAVVAVVDQPDPFSDWSRPREGVGSSDDLTGPSFQSPGDVVARAVWNELVHLELLGPATGEETVDRLLAGGLTITTDYDPSAQALADAAIAELRPEGDRADEVALATIDNRTGAIVALANSGSPLPILTEGFRQAGSAFKPIVLAALFEQGAHPDDLVDQGGPCRFGLAEEQGGGEYIVGGTDRGVGTVRAATVTSNNCAFVRLGAAAGLEAIDTMAVGLGLSTLALEGPFLSTPLGTDPVHGVELAGAYAAMANDGVYREPWLIREITNQDGLVLYSRDGDAIRGRRVLSEETATMLTAVLVDNVAFGTGTRARLANGIPAAGKTGTTGDFLDAWFVGYTPAYTTVVWVGDPDEQPNPIRIPGWSSFGGGLPAAVWGRYNDELHRGMTLAPFAGTPPLTDREPKLLATEAEIIE